MRISYHWLKEHIDIGLPPSELSHVLTMAGLEVEAVEETESVRGSLRGVVVAEVLSREKHPDADRLSVCTVDTGGPDPVQIVCGAPNVAAGQRVAVATVGTTLYPTGVPEPLVIRKSKIRGQESLGMICAEDELGIGPSHDGIMVLATDLPNGTPLSNLVPVGADVVFSIGLTPNRTDAMSHFGVARDLAAVLNLKINPLSINNNINYLDKPIHVAVLDATQVPRYAGCVIRGITVGQSPGWLKQKLETIGQRPINTVVDVTNYILHGLGQPLHAFDLDRIEAGRILVRTAAEGEKLTTLDGKERTLSTDDVVIADAYKPLCLAGIMGGLGSGTTEDTTAVFLESAFFLPTTVRKSAKRHFIHSESSFRFERGTDPQMVVPALKKAAELIIELCGGSVSEIIDIKIDDFRAFEVKFNFGHTRKLIGVAISDDAIIAILNRLEIEVSVDEAAEGWGVAKVPLYRWDVRRPADLAAEILRVYGQDNVTVPSKLVATPSLDSDAAGYALQERLADRLAALGFNEIFTNSLIPKKFSHSNSVDMLNPLSEDHAVLRDTMLLTGLEAIAHNLHRQHTDLKLYEFARTYHRTDSGFRECQALGLYVSGNDLPPSWLQKPVPSHIFQLRAIVEQIGEWLGIQAKFTPLASDDAELAFGLQWGIGEKLIGKLGKVKAAHLKPADIKQDVYYAIIDWDLILSLDTRKPEPFAVIPKFPSVTRDFSMEVGAGVVFANLEQAIRLASPKLVKEVVLFDVYEGPEGGNRSYAVSVTLQADDRTLDEATLEKTSLRIIESLEKDPRVRLRR